MSKIDDYSDYEFGYCIIGKDEISRNKIRLRTATTLKQHNLWFWARDNESGLIWHWCYTVNYESGSKHVAPEGYCKRCDVQLAPGWLFALMIEEKHG